MKMRERGFTLIELLVVIAIIGMLASIMIASLDSARKKGRDARRVADMRQIQLALALYANANDGLYPRGLYCGAGCLNANSAYIATIPKDPNGVACAADSNDTTSATATGCYRYVLLSLSGGPAPCTSYHLWTFLEVSGSPILPSKANAAAGSTCSSPISSASPDRAGSTNAQIYDVKP